MEETQKKGSLLFDSDGNLRMSIITTLIFVVVSALIYSVFEGKGVAILFIFVLGSIAAAWLWKSSRLAAMVILFIMGIILVAFLFDPLGASAPTGLVG